MRSASSAAAKRERRTNPLFALFGVSPRALTWAGVILALLFAIGPTIAADLTGRVIGISDGDTITVLDDADQQHKVRLSGIDAPEEGMPWSQQSKASLSEKIFGRQVTVHWYKVDRFGRLVGKVLADCLDVNLAQVNAGLAWHYKQYEMEQSEGDRNAYAEAENDAREHKRGLWSDPEPVAPWIWRRTRR